MNTQIIRVICIIICLALSLPMDAQECVPQDNESTELEGGKIIVTYGASTNSVSPKFASNILLGQPLVGQTNSTEAVIDYGFYAQFLLPPQAPNVFASEGELLDRIQVGWTLDPLGSAPNEGFDIFRDGVFLANVGPQVRNFNDFNVIAGRPYTYTVSGINKFGEGPLGEALGFQVPNGVVTGWVRTLNNRPVPNTQVTLLPMQGFSAALGEQDGAVTISDVENPFLPEIGNDWTMAFWVKTSTSNENGTILNFSNSDFEIKALPGADGISVSQGANSLSYNFDAEEWQHITLAFESSENTLRLYADSILQDQSFMDNVAPPDTIFFGQQNAENGWSGKLDEFRIYHSLLDELDLEMIMYGTASSNTEGLKHYWKFDEELGSKSFDIINRHQIYFCGAEFDVDRPDVKTAAVTNEEGYYRIEGVSYGTGTTFLAKPSKNFYFHKSLKFKSSEMDHVVLPDFSLPSKSTIEFWINNTNAGTSQTILSKKEGSNTFKIYSELEGGSTSLKLDINGNSESFGDLVNGFNHIAITMDSLSGEVKGYLNGAIQNTASYTIPGNWADSTYNWYLGASLDDVMPYYFNGLIDEVAIYDTLLSEAMIMAHAADVRDYTEDGLIVYFPMDEGNGNRVNNVGSYFLDFGEVNGAEWSNFAANQKTTPHEFTPNTRQVTLNPSVTSVDQVDFTDLSTLPVSGFVRFEGTDCFQKGVEILVNGTSFSPPIFTDSTGRFTIEFDPGFSGTLTPKFEDHNFIPAFWEVNNVTSPIAGILFNNTVKRKITCRVAGGDCGASIIDSLVTCKVKISTPNDCLERIHTFHVSEGGVYDFEDLPPLENLTIAVTQHSDPSIKTFFQVAGGSELDISLKDTIVDFIYYAPPDIEISNGLDPVSDTCSLIVLEQYAIDSIDIRMKEYYYNEEFCIIDTASIQIIDGISGVEIDSTLSQGLFRYGFRVGEPNPSPPYLKTLQVIGTSLAGRENSTSRQAVVTGIRSKEQTFTSKLPSVPILVLRDPPGDGSSAYFEKGETVCQNTVIKVEDLFGGALGGTIFAGGDVEIVAAPFGVGTISNVGTIADIVINGEFSTNFVNDSTFQTCLTFNERIGTSDDELLVGKDSDIFMGTATNIVIGYADVVSFIDTSCTVETQEILNIEPDSDFNSTYLYNRFQLNNFIIPTLEKLAEEEEDITLKNEYLASAGQWINILAQSDEIIDEVEYRENISFSAGTTYEYSMTSDTTNTSGSDTTMVGSNQTAYTDGFQFNDFGFSITGKFFTTHQRASQSGVDSSNYITTGYTLYDDDPGDAFSVNVGIDEKYKTCVYQLKAGQSSCPYEAGTANREAPNLQLAEGSEFVATNVPANEPAVFQFSLGNLSATNENWTYGFTSLAASNPDGAIIKLNGQPLNYVERFIVPFGESKMVTLTVEKGPLEYDYENLVVAMISECEYERNLALGNDLESDITFFSKINIGAHFIRPCSEVEINVPLQNYVIYNSENTPDSVQIIVSGYNLNEPYFESIKLQYRKKNGDGAWINIPGIFEQFNPNFIDFDNTVHTEVLNEVFTDFYWDTNTGPLADGSYEIRAVAECTGDATNRPGYSQVINIRIDREPPSLLGVPQPSDGVLNVGDEISFSFNQDINCDKIHPLNNIGLFVGSEAIAKSFSCIDNKIIIDPEFQNKFFENRIMRAELYDIEDLVGNVDSLEKWEFYIDRNELAWLSDSIEMTKYSDEEKSITAKIQNRGGYPVPYTIQDIPEWVHIHPNSGTLVANEIEEITFTVNENVSLGYLSDSIILHTETGLNPFFMGGDEILNLTTRVICRPDKWIVNPDNFNPSNFDYSMNFNLKLNIEGSFSEDTEDIVGAYVGDELRGVSRVEYNEDIDAYLVFITVFSNIVVGETIEFQIWDASECKLFVPVSPTFEFISNDIIGSPINPQVINTNSNVLRKIFIHPGWNWLSFNLKFENAAIDSALNSLSNPNSATIKTQTLFSMHSEMMQDWAGSLDSLSFLDLYQYFSENYDSISMVGSLLDPNTEIPLSDGWNWVGYIPNEKLPIASALSSLSPTDGDLIKSQVSFAQYVDNVGWIGNLHFMDAPNGYLLQLTNPDTLIYPNPLNLKGSDESYNQKNINSKNQSSTRSSNYWTVDATLYERSMNAIGLVVKNNDDNVLEENDEVAAFVGDEIRGSAKALYIPELDSYMIFMTIYANQDGELLTFKYFDVSANQELVLDEQTGFVGNSILGNVDDPELFHLSMTSVSDFNGTETMNVYPNPFSEMVTINFFSELSDDIELTIKDIHGKQITKGLVNISVGINVIEWQPDDEVPPGTYIVTLKDASSSYIKKIIYVK